jgi:rhamnosyltransferase
MASLVYILLASYNGEKYIEKQLDSLISQTYTDWSLLIRDDGSEDETVSIIKKYMTKDTRIKLIDEHDQNKGKGACQNFARLMEVAVAEEAPFILFCDQDDYWFANKIDLMFKKMIKSGCSMLYSDFLYADDKLNALPGSIQKSKSPFLFPFFKTLIVQNQVYGCTMIISGALAKRCLPIPKVAENHDYWISLVASGVNVKIYHLKKGLMLYRQHENNVTGSFKDHYVSARIKRLFMHFNILKIREIKKILMLSALYEQLNNDLATDNKKLLEGFFKSLEKSKSSIIFYCIKNNIKRQSFISTIVYFLILYTMDKQKFLTK